MTRIIDSMKTRITKLDAKIAALEEKKTPLLEERDNLLLAINTLQRESKESTPEAADNAPQETAATQPESVKEPIPAFLKGQKHG